MSNYIVEIRFVDGTTLHGLYNSTSDNLLFRSLMALDPSEQQGIEEGGEREAFETPHVRKYGATPDQRENELSRAQLDHGAEEVRVFVPHYGQSFSSRANRAQCFLTGRHAWPEATW